jgi:histidinol-phosphate phosphatase family protein
VTDVAAVLFDRDGTLIRDVPYNARPELVEPVVGAADALARVRAGGLAVGLVTNQSAIGMGLADRSAVDACHRRLQDLLGPLDVIAVCPHRAEDGCACRKPEPGLVFEAAAALAVAPEACVVVGDVGSDVEAARRAGARSVLVPTAATRPEEVRAAPAVAPDLEAAVARILRGRVGP